MRQLLLRAAGRAIFAVRGWTFDPLPVEWEEKQVIVGFPHSTWADTLMAFAGFAMVGQKGHVLVKKEAFRWPFAGLLRSLGAISVDRRAASGVVDQLAAEFSARDHFHLALVPEGTRHGAAKLRTGFWHLAKAANVPIVCWYLDPVMRRTRWVGRLVPGDDLQADLRTIKRMYADAGHEITGIED